MSCWGKQMGKQLAAKIFAFSKCKEPPRVLHPTSDFQPRRCIFKEHAIRCSLRYSSPRKADLELMASTFHRNVCVELSKTFSLEVCDTRRLALRNRSWSDLPVTLNTVIQAAAGAGASSHPAVSLC